MQWKTNTSEKWLQIFIRRSDEVIKISAFSQKMLGDGDATLGIDQHQEFRGSGDKWNGRMRPKASFAGDTNPDIGEAHAKTGLCQGGVAH